MLLSLPAGALADSHRSPRRDADRAGLHARRLGGPGGLRLALGVMTPWLLLGFTFLIGCGTALNGPAWQASVGDMVPRADLPAAVALNAMGFNMARSVGPALGGVIVAAAGAAAAFAVNAVSYIGLIAVLVALEAQPPSPKPSRASRWPSRWGRGSATSRCRRTCWSCCSRAASSASAPARSGADAAGRARPRRRRAARSTACCSAPSASARWAARFGGTGCSAHLSTEALVRGAGARLRRRRWRSRRSAPGLRSPFRPWRSPARAGCWPCRLSMSSMQMARRAGSSLAPCRSTRWRSSAAWRRAAALVGWLADTHGVAVSLLVAAAALIAAVVLGFVLAAAGCRIPRPRPAGPVARTRDRRAGRTPRSGPIVVTVE